MTALFLALAVRTNLSMAAHGRISRWGVFIDEMAERALLDAQVDLNPHQVEAALFNLKNARLNTLISERDMPVIAAELAHLLNWGTNRVPVAWASPTFAVRAYRWVRDQRDTESLEEIGR